MSTNYNDKYILKFKIDTNLVSSTDASSFNDKSIIALYNNYSDGDGVEIYFDKNEIKHRVTFSNFSGGSIDLQDTIRETTIKDDRYITFYGFKFNAAWYKTYSSQNTKFKIKLVEAYKYK